MNLNDIKNKLAKNAGNTQFLVILLVAVLFLIAALFMYKRYVASGINKNYVTNNEFSKTSDKSLTTADIYFFYTEWCPHCKTAKPVWADFKNQMSGKKVNGISLNFIEIDCDKDTATSDKFNVKGFPTIKLVKGKQVIEYDAKPSTANLIEFVNASLN
jgi:thioredoxin domain-containing protein 10